MELRWKVEAWTEYQDGMSLHHVEDPVLQYRRAKNSIEIGLQEPIWSDWVDVPTEYIQTQ